MSMLPSALALLSPISVFTLHLSGRSPLLSGQSYPIPMAWYSLLTLSSIPIFLYFFLSIPIRIEPPEIEKDGFFGNEEVARDDETIDPFTIKFTSQVKEMHRQAEQSLHKFSEGTFERRIASFLADFNWEQHSQFINSFGHFTTEIEGLSIHFVRTNLKYEKRVNRVPILLLPSSFGSFWSFFKVLPILSNPARHGFDFGLGHSLVFDVVIPSYPMTLFSESPQEKKLDKIAVARMLNKLMVDRLSYSQYYVYGDGGIGSEITSVVSTVYPTNVRGLIVKDPIIAVEGMRRQLQLYFLPSDSIETKVDFPLAIPALNDRSFATSLKYLIERWRESSESTDLDKEVTLDEISTAFSLFLLTNSLQSHVDLLRDTVPYSILEATTTVPTFVISSRINKFHVPNSLLVHKFMNLSRYDEISPGGMLYSLSKSADLAKKIFSFVELC